MHRTESFLTHFLFIVCIFCIVILFVFAVRESTPCFLFHFLKKRKKRKKKKKGSGDCVLKFILLTAFIDKVLNLKPDKSRLR
jgi:hypothetical protein